MIPFSKPIIRGNETHYISQAMESEWISDGEFVQKLESRLRCIFNVSHVLSTSNGTSALNLALLTVKHFSKRRSILVPGFCFQAAANVSLQIGLTPVFYDVQPETMQADVESIYKLLESNNDIAAIVVVHNYGFVSKDMVELRRTAINHGVYLIEDCAEAIFSKYPDTNRYVGTHADFGTFSLHATKTLTTGEGGLVITNNDVLNDYLLLCRSHGLKTRGTYRHLIPGNNFRLNNINAAFGNGQLDYYEDLIEKKIHIQEEYFSLLKDINNLLPPKDSTAIVWSFPVRFSPSTFKCSRDSAITYFRENEIETRPGFLSANNLGYFEKSDTPGADILSDTVIVLPAFVGIEDREIKYICDKLLSLRR